MLQATAVVLDNDRKERDDLRTRLSHCGVLSICFKDEWICLENIHHIKPSFAVLKTDRCENVNRFVNRAKAIRNNFPVLVLSNNNEVERFIQNNWLANLFFLRYPADNKEFQGAVTLLSEAKSDRDRPVLIAGSPERKKLIRGLPLLGLSKEPLLIQGEPGVGKKMIAKAIHSCSAAKNTVLDFIDARDISGQWIRAARKRIDKVTSDTGSPQVRVIENVENLPFSLQSQLLLLMDGFNGNGIAGKKDDICAPFMTLTGGDLESLVQKGGFRKDLYHRLSVLKVIVPPLRAYPSDIGVMAEYFAARYSIRYNGGIHRLPDEVFSVFEEYHWPGNVSELKSIIKQMSMAAKTNWMKKLSLPVAGGVQNHRQQPTNSFVDADEIHDFVLKNRDVSLKQAKIRYVTQVEKKIMRAALAQTNGNCKKAAGLLNVSYKTMLNKVKAYNLNGR